METDLRQHGKYLLKVFRPDLRGWKLAWLIEQWQKDIGSDPT